MNLLVRSMKWIMVVTGVLTEVLVFGAYLLATRHAPREEPSRV